jgi:glycosyltransferase involved in cell wall biosynthesis
MKVLVDCAPLMVGGGIQVAIALLDNLRSQSEIKWDAVASDRMKSLMPAELVADERLTFVARRWTLDRLWISRKLRESEARSRPDVVFTVFGPQFFVANAPHVVGFALPELIYEPDHGLPANSFLTRLANALRCNVLSRADRLVVETETARERLARCLGFDPEKISVVPNGVNPQLSKLPNAETRHQAVHGILVPSAYYIHKGLEIIPEVAAIMRRLKPDLAFEFRFTLESASRHWHKIVDLAGEHAVQDRVTTLGTLRLGDLGHAYREASAVCLPTLREISTAVYPESFFFQRPLVTSDIDFARELCGDAALFAPPGHAAVFAAQLINVLTSDCTRRRLVQAGTLQLSRAYPSAHEKFQMQLDILTREARRR